MSLRKKLAWIVTICLVSASVAIFLQLRKDAERYNTSKFYVAKTRLKWLGLSIIETGVGALGSRTANITQNDLVEKVRFDELPIIVKQMFPTQRICVKFSNLSGIRKPRYKFGYETPTNQQLVRLREKHNLINFKPNDSLDFSQIIGLADWVSMQWKHGTSGASYFDPANFDADVILSAAKIGYEFWCNVSALTYIQTAASIGIQARLISLTKDGYSYSDRHAVAEVWSNQYQKWVMVDPNFNIWYEHEGVPQSVLEIHNAYLENKGKELVVKYGNHRPISELEQRIPTLLAYYNYFTVNLRNDWASKKYFRGHPAQSDKATLYWDDKRLPPILTPMTKVSNQNDLYWDINKSLLTFGHPVQHTKVLPVYLDTLTPNFSHFEIIVDKSKYLADTAVRFDWTLHDGYNSLEVRSVNTLGHKGLTATIVLEVHRQRGD